MVREIPADAVKTLYVAESMTDKFADICNQIPAEVEIVRDSVFQSMSDTNTPQGILRRYIRQPQRRMIYLQVMRHRFF